MWQPRQFDGSPPPDMAAGLRYLQDRYAGPADLPGWLAHSAAAVNAVRASEETFSLQTRLTPQLRSTLRLVVASELGDPVAVKTLMTWAREDGLEHAVVQNHAAGHDGDEPEAALVRLVRRLARGDAIDGPLLTEAEANGWSVREVVEAIMAASQAVPLVWLLRVTRAD